jgi:hypothetical protein
MHKKYGKKNGEMVQIHLHYVDVFPWDFQGIPIIGMGKKKNKQLYFGGELENLENSPAPE